METIALEVCPICKKKAAPQFMWHFDDGERVCLECYHKEKKREPKKRPVEESNLASESKSAELAMKAIGLFLVFVAVSLGLIVLFYQLNPPRPLEKSTAATKPKPKPPQAGKPGDAASGDVADAGKKDTDKKEDGKDDKKDDAATKAAIDAVAKKAAAAVGANVVASGTGNNSKTERMAPTVQALITELPKKPGEAKDVPVPSAISEFVDKANEAAAALQKGQGAAPPAKLNPNEKTKAKAEETKAAAFAVANALIDKADPTGIKSADALAKLGRISTVFADVATQVAPPAPLKDGSASTGGNIQGASVGGRLESDVLETQGRAGYDPLEAVRQESEEGGPTPTTVLVQKNPDAPKPTSPVEAARLEAEAVRTTGIVQRNAALDAASLPAAFANAVRAQQGFYATAGGAAAAAHAQQLSVVVMSMRSDLLFDSGSAALRPASEKQLAEIARLLTNHPELPVLIRGYTDSKGNPKINRALSKKRAESVRTWLVAHLTNKTQNVSVQGLGALEPAAPNRNPNGSDNPAGREKNRRVTVTIPEHRETLPAVPQLRATQPLPQPQMPTPSQAQAQPQRPTPPQAQAQSQQQPAQPQVQAQPQAQTTPSQPQPSQQAQVQPQPQPQSQPQAQVQPQTQAAPSQPQPPQQAQAQPQQSAQAAPKAL